MLLQPKELLGWGRKQIEMRDLEHGEVLGTFNHKKSMKVCGRLVCFVFAPPTTHVFAILQLRFLASRGNRVYFASVQQGGMTQVYFMQY